MNGNILLNKKRRGRIFRYAPLILWIGIVLFASTGNAAMSETSRFIRPLLHFLFPNTPEETLVVYHAYIRKCAHFVEYAGLAFFGCRAFWSSSVEVLQKYWFVFAFLIVLFVASVDEYNQSFNPARTGSTYDVMLDCAGGATMILLFAFYKIFARKHS
jgi:VanZ family protein